MFPHQQFSRDLKIQVSNYKEGIAVDTQLITKYIQSLATADLQALISDAQKMAFWINVYNGLTNYWIIQKKIKRKMTEQPLLVMLAKVTIGGFLFSLDDVEHGVLRANRKSTYKFWKQFRGKDPRKALCVNKMDYRIHFALNCGAKSCPSIAFYDADNIDQQLRLAEQSFVAQEFIVNQAEKTIHCSRIFWLYKIDFEQVYINAPEYNNYNIKYASYDFSI